MIISFIKFLLFFHIFYNISRSVIEVHAIWISCLIAWLFSFFIFTAVCMSVCVNWRNSLIRQRWNNGGDSYKRHTETQMNEREKMWREKDKTYAHTHTRMCTHTHERLTATMLTYQKRKTTTPILLLYYSFIILK